jgi:hypothetical protein
VKKIIDAIAGGFGLLLMLTGASLPGLAFGKWYFPDPSWIVLVICVLVWFAICVIALVVYIIVAVGGWEDIGPKLVGCVVVGVFVVLPTWYMFFH